MAHPMQRYGDSKPTDGVLRVYARQGDMPRNDRGRSNALTIGTRTAGHRFTDVVFSDYALFEINRALHTVEWLQQLACQFDGEELPAELQKMLNVITGEESSGE